MGRRKLLLMQYQPTTGLNADFEELLQRFTNTETVRFEKFTEIWREMKMNYIFAGRQTEKECREFTEEMLKMALKYILPPYNFQVRVGGLYLLYGLFNQQPLMRKVRVRITPDKWKEIVEFQNEARRQQHLDVNYVFHKLRFDDCFIFAATESEAFFNLNNPGNTQDDHSGPEEFKDEQSVLYELFSDQFLEQLTQLHSHYHRVKVGLEGPEATEPSRSLNVIQPSITTSILSTVVAFQQRKQQHVVKKQSLSDTEQNGTDADDIDIDEIDIKNRKSHLKAKAFRNIAKAHKSRRHRQAVESDESPRKKGKKHKSSSETEDSSPTKKRKIGKKKKIKTEEEIVDKVDDEQAAVPDAEKETTTEEIPNIECLREATAGEILHMPSFDVEPSTSGTQNSSPGKRTRGKQKSPKKEENEKQKSPIKKTNKEKKPKKGSKEEIKDNKKLKGKMPSVRLQPLQRKKNSPKKSKGKTKKTTTEDNE